MCRACEEVNGKTVIPPKPTCLHPKERRPGGHLLVANSSVVKHVYVAEEKFHRTRGDKKEKTVDMKPPEEVCFRVGVKIL